MASLTEIDRASHEGDIVEIAQNINVDNPAFTQVFQINTTAPTAANCANVLATLITIMKKGGLKRST